MKLPPTEQERLQAENTRMKCPPWIKPTRRTTGLVVTMIDRNKGELTINNTLIVKVGSNCLYFEVGMEVEVSDSQGSHANLVTPFVKP